MCNLHGLLRELVDSNGIGPVDATQVLKRHPELIGDGSTGDFFNRLVRHDIWPGRIGMTHGCNQTEVVKPLHRVPVESSLTMTEMLKKSVERDCPFHSEKEFDTVVTGSVFVVQLVGAGAAQEIQDPIVIGSGGRKMRYRLRSLLCASDNGTRTFLKRGSDRFQYLQLEHERSWNDHFIGIPELLFYVDEGCVSMEEHMVDIAIDHVANTIQQNYPLVA